MFPGQLDIHMQQNKVGSSNLIGWIHKNQFKMEKKNNSKWITNLDIRDKTIKLLEEYRIKSS